MKKFVCSLIFFALFFASCGSSETEPTHTPTPKATNTPQPSATDTPFASSTATETFTPEPSNTPRSSPTPTANALGIIFERMDISNSGVHYYVFKRIAGFDLIEITLLANGEAQNCTMNPSEPYRIFCSGSVFPSGSTIQFDIVFEETLVYIDERVVPVHQSEAELLEILSGQASCELPCILGISPGVSTIEDLKSEFSEMNLFQDVKSNEWDGEPLDNNLLTLVSFSLSVFIQKDIVEGLSLGYYKSWYHAPDTLPLESFVTQYVIEDVLRSYGLPSKVYLLVHEPGIGGYFRLFLFYEELNFAIGYIYDGDVTEEDGELLVCKNDSYLNAIDIFSKTVNMDRTFEEAYSIESYSRLAEFNELSFRAFEEIYEDILAGNEFGCFSVDQ